MRKNKKWFLEELRSLLSTLDEDEVEDILADYEEHFVMAKKKKKTDAQIIASLGDPSVVAKQIIVEHKVNKAKQKPTVKNVFKAVLASVGLGFFNLVFVLGPFMGFFAVVLALCVVGLAITVSGLAVTLSSFAVPVFVTPQGAFLALLGVFFAGITLTTFGLLFSIGAFFVVKAFFKATLAYLKLNLSVVKGSARSEETTTNETTNTGEYV